MATLRERAAEWSDGWAAVVITAAMYSPTLRTKRFDRALIRWNRPTSCGRNQDAAWAELRESAVAMSERARSATRKSLSLSWRGTPEVSPTITPEDTLAAAGISTTRQARYQRRMSSLLAGRGAEGGSVTIYDDLASVLQGFHDGMTEFDKELSEVQTTLRTLARAPAGGDEVRRLLATIIPIIETQERNFARVRSQCQTALERLGGAPEGRG
jgi:hypothetical protein